MKICGVCKEPKEETEFAQKGKYLQWACRKCQAEYRRQHYLDNKQKYIDKASRITKELLKTNRDYIWDLLLGSACGDCGENDPLVLEFDHLYDKSFNIGNAIRERKLKFVIEELKKCEVVCANCHKIRTQKRGNHWRWQRLTNDLIDV